MVRLDRITMQGFKSFANRITIPFPGGYNVICGPNGSGKSTRWDTEVILDTGEIKPIGEIVETALEKSRLHVKLDDGVFTPENPENIRTYGLDPEGMKVVKKDISAFIKREGEEHLYKFTTKTGKSAVTTGCHPVMIFRNGKIISEVIEKLKKGDLIATPRKLEFPEIDIKLPMNDEKTVSKTTSHGPKPKTIKLPDYINEDFARFLGYLVGDGCIIEKAPRCDFTNMDAELVEDFTNIARGFGIEPSIYSHKKRVKVVALHSIILRDSLVKIFKNNVKKEHKHMPSIILFSRKSVLANFLAGLFDCDGTIRKDNPTFEYTTMSEKLANQVQLALLRFGIVSRKTKKMKHATNTKMKTKRPYFYITIEGVEKLKLLYENIPIRCTHKKDRLEKCISRNVKPGNNLDVLPQEVNILVRGCVTMLGMEYKNLRKTYPFFAAYMENRCCPTRNGIKKTLEILNPRLKLLRERLDCISVDQKDLIRTLTELKIRRSDASKSIGLNPGTINTHWSRKVKARQGNLRKLNDFVKVELEHRIKDSEKLIGILENLSSSDIFWDRIDKIEKVPGEKWVYDLTIPNCHNFIGNGIFVHNSNIIDALLFVLGTTSARSIRALKLQNLLFNGARDKKPADFCEVSIYLDNTDNKIPGDEKEVKVTRRITRSGISIYKLNGRTVTRAKILDILSYANLAAEGYNIIMQGDVTKIIEMSPNERKGIIDEISGISEFDEKKEKATREMEKVETRVRENMIVVAEKQKLVSRLKQEKENAEKYRAVEAELRKSKASLLKRRLKDVTQKHNIFDKEIEENTKKFDMMSKELTKVDDELEKKEKGVLRKGDELIQKSRNYDVLRNIDRINNEILRKRDRISFNERELERVRGNVDNRIVREILDLKHPGVYGTVSSLVDVPKKYSIALEVAIGRHKDDIVVDTDDTAAHCIRYLKEKRLGRARFIPLNKIINRPRKRYDGKMIGYAIGLIKFGKQFLPAFEYVLSSTLVVEDIDAARKIRNFRVATLDGDLVETSGVMIGGFYKKSRQASGGQDLMGENEKLEQEIEDMENELAGLKTQEQQESVEVVKLQTSKTQEEKDLETFRKRRKELYEERMVLQSVIGRAKIEKAKLEASMDNLKAEFEDYKDVEKFFDQSQEELQERVRRCLIEINQIGPVNMKAIDEYQTLNVEFEELKKKLDGLLEEKEAVLNIVTEVEKRRYEKFMETFTEASHNFSKIYKDMTNGDGLLRLEVENNIDSGLIIEANPSGKKIINLDSMSGGEKTLTSLAFLFAVMQHYSAPFYVLDEIDAALDKANTRKIDNLIKKYSSTVQFIVITHNDLTIAEAEKVFGVSMEGGISKVFGIEMPSQRG